VEASCVSGKPFLGYHDEVDDCSNFISERQWSKSVLGACTVENYICIDEDCKYRIAAGIDFMCTENCQVCGDGVVQGDEECDSGVLKDENCFFCRIGCTCDDNATRPCTGRCFGGQVADGTVCDPRAPANTCVDGTCVPFACCGDGIVQPGELCDDGNLINDDNCSNVCTVNAMARRSYNEPREIRKGLSEHAQQRKVYKAKTIDINQFVFDFWNWMLDLLGFDITGQALVDMIIGWFQNTGTDIYLPPEERGVLWYAVFPFLLRPPANLDCSLGLGSFETLRIFAVTLLPLSLLLGWILPAGWLNLFFMAFGLLFLTLFMGIAYGYPFPGAFLTPSTPPLPECLITDIAETLDVFNSPCINWPEGVVLDPPDGSCRFNRTLLDCRTVGWNDGFDWIVFNLEYHAPALMDSFRGSFLFNMLTQHEYWADIFERFDYGADPIPAVDIYYCSPTTFLLGIGTLAFFGITLSLFLVGLGFLLVAIFNQLWALWLATWAVVFTWEDWEEDTDK